MRSYNYEEDACRLMGSIILMQRRFLTMVAAFGLALSGCVAPVAERSPALSELIRVPLTRQATDHTCSVAALQSVLAYYGDGIREDLLASALGTTDDGTPKEAMAAYARSKGYEVQMHFDTTLEELQRNPDTAVLLDSIREWETARRQGAFSRDQQTRLQNPALDFHLEPAGSGAWSLFPYHASEAFRHEQTVRQPGEPTAAAWTLLNPDAEQPLQFRVQASGKGGSVSGLTIEMDHAIRLEIPGTLKAGESLVVDGTGSARLYDDKGRQTDRVALKSAVPRLATGRHTIAFDCAFAGDVPPSVEVTFKTRGAAEKVPAAR
jgi:hypothetical protein